jgi:hypothetical protein
MIKVLKKLGTEESQSNIIKAICDKPIGNIITKWGKISKNTFFIMR